MNGEQAPILFRGLSGPRHISMIKTTIKDMQYQQTGIRLVLLTVVFPSAVDLQKPTTATE